MTALRRQALGDGALDFLLLLRDERERQQPSPVHLAAYTAKKDSVLKALEREAGDLAATPFNIGHVGDRHRALLSRLPLCRRGLAHAASAHRGVAQADFAARPSVRATEPVDDS